METNYLKTKMSEFNQNTKSNESQQHTPVETMLQHGQNILINSDLPEQGSTPVIASIKTGRIVNGEGDSFDLIDLRAATINDTGARQFSGYGIDPTVDFLVVKSGPLDLTEGFKGIRILEGEVPFGREHQYGNRFSNLSEYTSRNHFSVEAHPEGSVTVKDLNSTNGTLVEFHSEKSLNKDWSDQQEPMETPSYPNVTELAESPQESKVSPWESEKSRQLTAEILSNPNQFAFTKDFLERLPFMAPVNELEVEGQRYLLSAVTEGGRALAVLYADMGDQMFAPRFLYKSNSEGGWRAPNKLDLEYDELGQVTYSHYGKGIAPGKGGYVQETKCVDELSDALDRMQNDPNTVIRSSRDNTVPDRLDLALQYEFVFNQHLRAEKDNTTVGNVQRIDTYESEIKISELNIKDIYTQQPGHGFNLQSQDGGHIDPIEYFENLELPQEFMPDFSKPAISSSAREHSILGKIIIDRYPVSLDGEPYFMSLARDSDGRAWIDSIRKQSSKPNSYGIHDEVSLAGALVNKAIEYRSQVNGLEKGTGYRDLELNIEDTKLKSAIEGQYADITPAISRIPVIKAYKAALGQG